MLLGEFLAGRELEEQIKEESGHPPCLITDAESGSGVAQLISSSVVDLLSNPSPSGN